MAKSFKDCDENQMKLNSILKRESDGKLFKVDDLSYWSYISSTIDSEKDCIKWYGDELYVSNSKGHSYIVVKNKKASLQEVMVAIDNLAEQHNALLSEEGRVAYQFVSNNLLTSMGWTHDDFINALSEKLQKE